MPACAGGGHIVRMESILLHGDGIVSGKGNSIQGLHDSDDSTDHDSSICSERASISIHSQLKSEALLIAGQSIPEHRLYFPIKP
jgi:hypothetical protein